MGDFNNKVKKSLKRQWDEAMARFIFALRGFFADALHDRRAVAFAKKNAFPTMRKAFDDLLLSRR